MTPIGLGLAALGRPAYITAGRDQDLGADRSVEAMERRCHEVLDAAHAGGIRYVDVARSYGYAERFLSSWFDARQVPANAVTVGSKWGYSYTGNWQMDAPVHETKNLSRETLTRQLAESRALLGDRLGLYQIHSATLESGVLDDPQVLSELLRVRAQGLVIGLTVTGARQAATIRRALAVNLDGENPFQVVQATWNLLEPSSGEALAEAHALGWGVIVKEVFANGRLAGIQADDRFDALADVAGALNASQDQVAMAAALSQPWIDVVLSGAATPSQIESHAGSVTLRLTSAHRHALDALAQPADRYWTERASRRWR